MGERRRTIRPGIVVIAAVLAVALVVVLAALGLYARGGIAAPAERARTEAAKGYAAWVGSFEEEAAARQAALEPVLGEPIEETWYITCRGFSRGGPIPAVQTCDLSVLSTYAIDWAKPRQPLDEALTVLEGTDASTGQDVSPGENGPWARTAAAGETEPRGKVAEAGSHGTVYVYAPDRQPVETGEVLVTGFYPDQSITKETVPAAGLPKGAGTVKIRRKVKISETNIGCIPRANLSCGTTLDKPVMPRIDGYSR